MSLVDGLLTHVCRIRRPVMAQNSRGGEVASSYTTVATGVPCVVFQTSDQLQDKAPGKQVNVDRMAIFDIDWKGRIRTNDVIDQVAPYWDPTSYEMDDFGSAGQQPTQFRVVNPTDPNLEGDHLEVPLVQMQGRKAVG